MQKDCYRFTYTCRCPLVSDTSEYADTTTVHTSFLSIVYKKFYLVIQVDLRRVKSVCFNNTQIRLSWCAKETDEVYLL